MNINLCRHDCTELWDQVLYKKLSNYPDITDWELKNILDFIQYETNHHREVSIICDQDQLSQSVQEARNHPEKYKDTQRPEKITECTACRYRKGCLTKYVCHTAPLEKAILIFQSQSLLSAVRARKLPADVLAQESRNAAHDPEDFFEYVMFTWGNCQAGDRLVMERKMDRIPTEEDMGVNLTPGVRFYFEYDRLDQHPMAVHDGFLPIKVRDEVILDDYVYAIIIPTAYQEILKPLIPATLIDKVYYVENDCPDVWDWSEKVYSLVEALAK